MLEYCRDLIAEDLDMVENQLRESLFTEQPLLMQVVKYFKEAKGKRLRPMAVLLTGQLGEYRRDKLIPLAAGIEVLHMATLVHDDMIDSSLYRHGKETIHLKWNKDIGLLLGDYLYAKSMGLLSSTLPTVMKIVIPAIVEMVEGEMEQQQNAYNLDIDEVCYFERIRKKTASLIRACCKVGGYIAGLRGKNLKALELYGEYLGMAFQIRDDCIDYQAVVKDTGKSIGNDFYQGVVTLPLIHYIENNVKNKGERVEIHRLMKKGCASQRQEDKDIFDAIVSSGSLDYALKIASEFVKRAVKQLEILPASTQCERLKDLAHFAVLREG